jgi:cell division transport system ATP-binding protein
MCSRVERTSTSRLPTVIETFGLSKAYGRGVFALRDLTLSIAKGEFVFLTGPSGAGKSTLLRLLLVQERPTLGDAIVAGRNLGRLRRSEVQDYRRTVGCVFQDFKLIPTRTVFENVAFALEVIGVPTDQRRKRAYQTLKRVNLAHRMSAYPMELSGGEQQRVAVARALVNDPLILLADEPTGNLDPAMSKQVMTLLSEINSAGTTVLVATHDPALIQWVDRRTIQLEQGRERSIE